MIGQKIGWLGDWAIRWSFGAVVKKRLLIGQMDGSKISEYEYWKPGALG